MENVPARGRRPSGGPVNRNVVVRGERTSMRLEPEFWDALEEVCRRERIEAGELIRRAEQHREGSTRTDAVRAYLLTYFRDGERALRASVQAGTLRS